jgi:archaellum component FlaC
MTIDERLEKLVERHETLTQTVELLAREMQEMKSSIEGIKSYTNEIAEGTARLLHIAEIHEHRITRLEGDQ